MNIIPSVFLEKFDSVEMKDMVQIFEFYADDFPHPGSFEAKLLQCQVRTYNKIVVRVRLYFIKLSMSLVYSVYLM